MLMEEIERNGWSGEDPFTGALLIQALQKQDRKKARIKAID